MAKTAQIKRAAREEANQEDEALWKKINKLFGNKSTANSLVATIQKVSRSCQAIKKAKGKGSDDPAVLHAALEIEKEVIAFKKTLTKPKFEEIQLGIERRDAEGEKAVLYDECFVTLHNHKDTVASLLEAARATQ